MRALALSTNFLPECRAIPRTISGLAESEAEAPAPERCLKCWQRRDGAPRWCGQKKAPTERGFSSYLEADPSCLAADRNITVRAFDAPVNSAVGSVCMGNMLPIVRNCNRTSQFLFCV